MTSGLVGMRWVGVGIDWRWGTRKTDRVGKGKKAYIASLCAFWERISCIGTWPSCNRRTRNSPVSWPRQGRGRGSRVVGVACKRPDACTGKDVGWDWGLAALVVDQIFHNREGIQNKTLRISCNRLLEVGSR